MTNPHEIEEMEHGRDVPYWVAGVPCATYEEACIMSGCDTPEDIAREMSWRNAQEIAEELDAMEARGGPEYFFPLITDDCPF